MALTLRDAAGGSPRWGEGPWATDPLALDEALQLGLLWGWVPFGGRSLPTGVGTLVFGQPGAWSGPLRASLTVLGHDDRHASFRISVQDGAGRALAALEDVAFHAVPSGRG